MGIQSLQRFIEANCPGACVSVDLLKIARSVAIRRVGGVRGNYRQPFYNRLCLVVDGECCLDRLYGGYFSDWVCGGQWNRMVQFLSVLIQTIQNNNIELSVFFNGGLEQQRMEEWTRQQQADRKKINQVLKHVATKATPPPKIWWIPPVCLRTCLRMALRHLNVTVVCSMDDHHQEVIAFCRENNFHGLLAEDAEYAVFDPPRYFSSEQLKLTYKGSLETKEFILDEVAKSLNINPNRFCVFAALLGNYLLTEDDLASFHKTLCPENKSKPIAPDTLIKAVVDFVRNLPSVDNLDTIGSPIFGASCHDKLQKFKHCVQYYLNGTKDGFLRYRPTMQGRRQESGCYPGMTLSTISENTQNKSQPQDNKAPESKDLVSQQQAHSQSGSNAALSNLDAEEPFPQPPPNSANFASETAESVLSSLTAYHKATGGYGNPAPDIVINPPHVQGLLSQDLSTSVQSKPDEGENFNSLASGHQMLGNVPLGPMSRQVNGGLLLSSSTSSSSSNSSPHRLSPDAPWPLGSHPHKHKPTSDMCLSEHSQDLPMLPKVPPEVMRTASERHQKGLMSPWIYQLLSQGEIKIAVTIEDEVPRDLPSGALLYRPLRQMVYAILFNMHHLHFMARQKKEKEGKEEQVPDIIVKEWVWSKQKQYHNPDLVPAIALGWAVPTVQRLWFGPTVDDKKRRLRAFLTCMRSDAPLMLNTSYIPQHLLVMCCVLRYIMTDPDRPILRRQELDAFLAQAVSPHLMDAQHTQNMQLPIVTTRGAELAALFMQGVECALFANDACGAPIPWLMCCPWLFFDGKLFHHKLLKANSAKGLIEVCDGHVDQMAKVERMRNAILEGIQVEFAHPPLVPLGHPGGHIPGFRPPPPLLPPAAGMPMRGRGRGVPGRRGMIARGGQLEIAGVVVGSWGANYGHMPRSRGMNLPPQVTSVGGMRRYGQPLGLSRGFMPRRPVITARVRKPGPVFPQVNKLKQKKKKAVVGKEKSPSQSPGDEEEILVKNGLGRGCTVETNNGRTVQVSQLVLADGSEDSPVKPVPVSLGAGTVESRKFVDSVENGKFADAEPVEPKPEAKEESSPVVQLNNHHPSVLVGSQGQGNHVM